MIPTRPALTYLRLGVDLLRRHLLPKLLSEVIGLCLILAPLALTAMATADYSGVYATGEEMAAQRPTREAIGSGSLPELPPMVEESTVGPGPGLVLASIALLFALLIARAILDAWILGRWRDELSAKPRPLRRILKRSGVGFFGVALLQLALLSGVSLFIAPVALRLTIAAATRPELNLPVVLLGSLAAAALTLLTVRLLTMYAAAWVAWRPSFLAGSMVAAFGVPLRDFKGFGSLAAWWGLIQGGAAVSLSIIALALVSPSLALSLSMPALIALYALLATLWCLFSAWMDAAVTTMVGHTIGEFAIVPLNSGRPVSANPTKSQEQRGQERIARFVEGVYSPPASPEEATPSFATLLGYEPHAGSRSEWVAPAALRSMLQGEIVRASGGTQELRLIRDNVSNDEDDAPGTGASRATDREAICGRLMAWSTAIDGPYDESFNRQQGFERLTQSLSPALVRTRAGSPELRYGGFRPPRSGAQKATEVTTSDHEQGSEGIARDGET